MAAGRRWDAESRDALARLCQAYWYPLYAFVRRCGRDAQQAQDLTQGFFARLLEKNNLAAADRSRGKFRTFLLTALKHYMANEADRAAAQKRGGGRTMISFDLDNAEARYRLEPSHEITPQKLFDRRWALTLLDGVLADLQAEYRQAGKEAVFESLKGTLTGDSEAASYAQIGRQLNMSEGAVKVAVHRLRRRYRQKLRQTIADSVASEEQVDEEIRELFGMLEAP